ncbi:MAG: hypothetical protein WCG20_02270 [bacterium]
MVFINKKILFITFLGLLLTGASPLAYAQTADPVIPDDLSNSTVQYDTGPSANDITLEFNPQNPGAFQDVTVRTNSDYIDLNRYNSTWFVDGKKITEGIGQRTATLRTRGYGQRTNIIILIQLPDTLIKKTLSFEPQDMTVLWEAADAYVPPFYEGKKLLPREGLIKAVAIPNFKNEDGSSFRSPTGVYRWLRNGNVVSEATGYAKDSYSFKNNKIRAAEQITVTASDTAGGHEATQSVSVVTYKPKILFYEKNNRTGIINPFAKTTLNLIGNAATIIAEPFFFSTTGNPNSLTYNWTMNKSPITLSDVTNQKILTLQNPGGSGNATLGLEVLNPNSLFQGAGNQLPITFNKN